MRFAFFSTEGLSLGWQLRLLAEGHEVRVFLREPDAKNSVGKGLAEEADSIDALKRWAGQDPTTVYVFDLTGFGSEADALRAKGKRVIGGSHFGDRLETRKYGESVARTLGIRTPKTVEVSSLDEAIEHMKQQPKEAKWYFKPDGKDLPSAATYGGKDRDDLVYMLEHFKEMFGNIPGILQVKVDGIVIDTAWWWNGQKVLGYIGMIEYKKAFAKDLGPSTGCATNLLWRYESDSPLIAKKLKVQDVEELFRRLDVVPGEYDINAVISERDKQPYFLEWGPRFGWDADATYLQGLTIPFGQALADLAARTLNELPFKRGEYWGGIHVAVPPYPYTEYKDKKHSAYRVPVRGLPDIIGEEFYPYGIMYDREKDRVLLGSAYGNVGVALGKGETIEKVVEEVYESAEKLQIPDLFYRPDFGKHEKEDLKRLRGWSYEVQ